MRRTYLKDCVVRRKRKSPGPYEIEPALLEEIAELGNRITTLRFLYYRLVSRGIIPKDTKDTNRKWYNKVSGVLTDLRDCGCVPVDQIVDDGAHVDNWHVSRDMESDLQSVLAELRAAVWGDRVPWILTESASLAQVLRSTAYTYRVPIAALGGQASLSQLWEIAREITPESSDGSAVIYFLGDYDPSGIHIERNTQERLEGYDADFDWIRLAITPEQVEEYGLTYIDKKDGDGKWYKTIETEALGQQRLIDIVTATLDAELTPRTVQDLDTGDKTERARVKELLGWN